MEIKRSTEKGSSYRGSQPLDRPYVVTGTGNVVVDVDRLLRDPRTALQSFHRALRPGGVCLLSVRDYAQDDPGRDRVLP